MIPKSLKEVIEGFKQFPGIGPKTARRLGFFILNSNFSNIQRFANSILNLIENIQECANCYNIAEEKYCDICNATNRDEHILCIVENASDISLFEQTGFKGKYHVLGGTLSPLDGIGPEDLNLDNLINKTNIITEIVIATNPSVEGEATALYILNLLKDLPIKVSRLARGIPSGGNLEYVDELTLLRSYSERVPIKS